MQSESGACAPFWGNDLVHERRALRDGGLGNMATRHDPIGSTSRAVESHRYLDPGLWIFYSLAWLNTQ